MSDTATAAASVPAENPPATRRAQTSRIPQSYAAEVLLRKDELGWTLRDIAGWLTAKLGQDISHRTVDRFIASQRRKAALDAMKPLHELLMQDMEELREAIGEERRMGDDTEEEIERARRNAPDKVELLEADHARGLRKIRSLISQFNAFGRHVPKPDSLAVPVCTPVSDHFTPSAPLSVPEVASGPSPAAEVSSAADPDSGAVPVCTPDLNDSTRSEPHASVREETAPAEGESSPVPPVADTSKRTLLPNVSVFRGTGLMTFEAWLAAQPEALAGHPLEIDPAWVNSPSDVFFFDVSEGGIPFDVAYTMMDTRPEYEPRMVFVLPPNATSAVRNAIPSDLNAPIRLPLTKEKINAALLAVAEAKKNVKPPKRRAG